MPGHMMHRIHQTVLAICRRNAPVYDPALFPSELVQQMFALLAPHDQRHLLAVHGKAHGLGLGLDEHTCMAALLHDIGKASLSGQTVSVVDRIRHVVARGKEPSASFSGDQTDGIVPIDAIALTQNHGVIGAARLRALGVSETICHLVEMHDHSSVSDPRLIHLQELDNTTP